MGLLVLMFVDYIIQVKLGVHACCYIIYLRSLPHHSPLSPPPQHHASTIGGGWAGSCASIKVGESKGYEGSIPKPFTPNPKPQTPNPKPQTANCKPQTHNPQPHTPNPKHSYLTLILGLVECSSSVGKGGRGGGIG